MFHLAQLAGLVKHVLVSVFHNEQLGDLAKHGYCFGFGSSCFDVSSHAATPATSSCVGSFNLLSTSLVCNRATNLLRSLPLNVSVFPFVLISCCDSWMYAQSKPVIDSLRIHLAIWLCGLFSWFRFVLFCFGMCHYYVGVIVSLLFWFYIIIHKKPTHFYMCWFRFGVVVGSDG